MSDLVCLRPVLSVVIIGSTPSIWSTRWNPGLLLFDPLQGQAPIVVRSAIVGRKVVSSAGGCLISSCR